MAKVDIDVVDFEYVEEVIRVRFPELHIESESHSSIVIQGPLAEVTRFMKDEYCEGMDLEDAEYYMSFIEN